MSTCCSSRSRFEEVHEELRKLGLESPELQPFQTEPAQMNSGAVGKTGYLRLGFTRSGSRSVLSDLDRRVPFLVQKALYWDEALPGMPCVFIITTTGCVLQGDRLALHIDVGKQACAHVTTQSATKVHMMNANYAIMQQKLTVEEDGYLEYLPDPVIPHRTSRYLSSTDIRIAESGSLLYSEVLLPGRKFHHEDELFGFALYSAAMDVRRLETGLPLFAEKSILRPGEDLLRHAGSMNGLEVFGNVLFIGTPERSHAVREKAACFVDMQQGLACGASLLPEDCGVLFKVLGSSSEVVKACIRDFWQIARQAVTGTGLPPAFLWR